MSRKGRLNMTMASRLTLVAVALGAVFVQSGCSLPGSQREALSAEDTEYQQVQYNRTDRGAFRRTAYAATGIGLSHLDPDTSGVPTADVNDRVNNGGQITIGADLSRQFSVELHSADLGSAGLSPAGRINYHMHGASALIYAGKNRHRYRRRGLTGYGRLGVGKLDNSAVGENVRYKQLNSTQVLIGAGVEYGTRIGLGFRGEMISFDEDVNYAQLALIYRLGRKPERAPVMVVQSATPVVAPVTAVAVMPVDSDHDTVTDNADQCPETPAGVSVDTRGCALFAGVLEGVNFLPSSADLTQDAEAILDSVAATLADYPDVALSVSAHTDSSGAAEFNQNLSAQRAETVVSYLSIRGVDRQRMTQRAYGESQPIDTNDTPDGRLRNGRVELHATQALQQ